MKRFINQLVANKNNKITISILFAIFALIVLGCSGGSKTPMKPLPSEYVGSWTGSDGSTISIRGDGSGDYHSGNFKVEGGKAEMSEDGKSLSITFFGIGKTLKIDQAPSGNQMKLEGVTYSKGGGSTTSTTTSDKSGDSSKTTSSGEIPSNSELNAMVQKTLKEFTEAVDREDFTDFRESTSSAFQGLYTAENLKTAFATFVTQKDKFVPIMRTISSETPSYSPAPTNTDGELVANGTVKGKQLVTFELSYVKEDGDWKVQKIRVKL